MIDLDQLSKEEHYHVPEGYFENLPMQVMGNIHRAQRRKRNLWFSGVAAVAVIIVCSTIIINFNQKEMSAQKEIVVAETPAEEQLQEQMADYYSGEFAQMDYLNY